MEGSDPFADETVPAWDYSHVASAMGEEIANLPPRKATTRDRYRALPQFSRFLVAAALFLSAATALAQVTIAVWSRSHSLDFEVLVRWATPFSLAIHLITLVAFLWRTLGIQVPKELGLIQERIRMFKRCWIGLWSTWSVLYAWFLFYELNRLRDGDASEQLLPPWWKNWIEDSLNNASTVCVLLCVYVLSPIVVRHRNRPPYGQGAICFLGIVFVESIVASVFRDVASVPLSFRVISGVGAGIGLGLLASRLDASPFDPPTIITVSLLAYAMLQPAYFMFPSSQLMLVTMTTLALFFKVALFLHVHWVLGKGLLRDHFLLQHGLK